MPRLVRLLPLLALAAALLLPAGASGKTQRLHGVAGPFKSGNFNVKLPKQFVRAPRRAGYVTRMNARLVDSRGRRVGIQDVMLHHLVFLNAGAKRGSKRTSCPGRSGEPFWGTGEERQRLILPRGFGYLNHKTDRWFMQVMLMSHSVKRRNVYVRYDYTFVTGKRLKRVRPFWLRANGCNPQPSYPVPGGGAPGSDHVEKESFKVPFSGRIVAAGGHLHGGAKRLTLNQPRCGGRELIDNDPMYARPRDPVYKVRPILHEPGPVSTKYYTSPTGIPIQKGQRLDVNGIYDGEIARARVMSIMHIYVHPDRKAGAEAARCAPLPSDGREFFLRRKGRLAPPYVKVPLNVYDPKTNRTRAVDELPGPAQPLQPGAVVDLVDYAFSKPKITLPLGARLTWRFRDREAHNVQIANAPRVVGTGSSVRGQRYTTRFKAPGRYQLFCYLHPVTMHQQVDVYEPAAPAPQRPPASEPQPAPSPAPAPITPLIPR